jgi:hypothetical protein
MGGPNNIIDRIPQRGEFERRIVSEAEFDHYRENGWERVKTGDKEKFKESFNDPVAGKQFVMEIPKEDYKTFAHEHQGGRLTEMQQKAMVGTRKDQEGGEETVSIENRLLPAQAGIRRKEQ